MEKLKRIWLVGLTTVGVLLCAAVAVYAQGPTDPVDKSSPEILHDPVVAPSAPEAIPESSSPDAYGYVFKDSNELGGPTYNFEDISTTGTPLYLTDDDVSAALPIGFDMTFYGTVYTQTYVSSNGWMSFLPTTDSGCCSGEPIPTAGNPVDALIAGWWEDLGPTHWSSIHYQTLGTTPNRRFIVQFTDVPHYDTLISQVTFQYKLFEGTNVIEVHYQAAPSDGGTHSAGIENENGTIGLQYYHGKLPLNTPLAVRYYVPTAEVLLSPGVQEQWGEAGSTVVYTETVHNLTGASDSFTLTRSSNTWPTMLSISNTGTLSDGAAFTFTVQVQIPPGALAGTSDRVTIAATSANSPTMLSDSTTLSTTTLSGQYGYATADSDNRLWIIDPVLGVVVKSINTLPYGNSPLPLALSPDGQWLYVGLEDSDRVLVISTTTNLPVTTIAVDDRPVDIAFTCDGSKALVTHRNSYTLAIIDTATLTVTASLDGGFFSNPSDIAVNGCTGLAYVANWNTDTIAVIDTDVPTVTAVIPNIPGSHSIVIAPDGQKAYTVDNDDNIVVVDLVGNTFIEFWKVGSDQVRELDISPDGRWLYVADDDWESLLVVDTRTGQLEAQIPMGPGQGAYDVDVSPDGGRVFVTSEGSPAVINIVDTASRAVVDTILTTDERLIRLEVYPSTCPCKTGLQVDKSVNPLTVETGQAFTYTINYTYTDTTPLQDAVLVDQLADGVTFVSASGNPQVTDSRVAWSLGTLNNGASGSVDLTAIVHLVTTNTTVLTNTAWGAPLGEIAHAPVTVTAPTAGVALDPPASTLSTLGGYTATHQVRLYNVGTTGVDSFTLNIPTTGWKYTIYSGTTPIANTGPIPSFGSLLLDIAVLPPDTATSGMEQQATLNATSDADPTADAQTALTTHVARPGYVFAADNDEIRVVDTLNHLSTDVVIDTSAYGTFPFRGALSPDGKWLYASLRDDGQVLVVDTANLAGPHITVTVDSGPHGIAFSADGAYAFVANQDSGTVSVIDTISHTVVATIPVGIEPYSIASNPCLDKLYVTNQDDDTVSVIDTGGLTVTKVFTVPNEPWDVVFSPSGDRAYISGESGGSLGVIDTATDAFVDAWYLFTDSRFAGLDISPDGGELYAVDRNNEFGFVVDTSTGDVTATLSLQNYGWEVAAFPSSAGPYVYMSIKDDDQVQVMNANTHRIVGSIPVPGGPRGLALFPPNTFCSVSVYLPLVLRNH